MQALTLAILAFILYIAAASWQGLALTHRLRPNPLLVRSMGAFGLVFHLALIIILADLGALSTSSLSTSAILLGALVVLLLILVSLFKPVLNAAVALFPLAGVTLLLSAGLNGTDQGSSMITPGIALHALSSALAFAVLSIAAVQAVIFGLQNQALRHHHTRGIVQSLPPLTTMERLLFELIWAGMALLTVSIASGILFLDNLFAQHLAHKTILSLAAWVIFATLLFSHHRLGWRGMRAVRWTLGGCAILLLAYFGSKFVLEVLINRG